uniref:Uncharacterized protein n=1 Tax=Salix viminalis TaxID=40686 RepID=A0A6N2LKK8_SALVM
MSDSMESQHKQLNNILKINGLSKTARNTDYLLGKESQSPRKEAAIHPSQTALSVATTNYADDQNLRWDGLLDNTLVASKKSNGVDRAQMNEEFQVEMSIV